MADEYNYVVNKLRSTGKERRSMVKEVVSCVWCGTSVTCKPETDQHPWFCSDCDEVFEVESQLSLHPMEERFPYYDGE